MQNKYIIHSYPNPYQNPYQQPVKKEPNYKKKSGGCGCGKKKKYY